MIKMTKGTLLQNKPIFVGFSILELSKVHMYTFHYKHMLPNYPGSARLLFTDTDSLCYSCEGANVYTFMKNHLDLFDTSNYSPEHPLFSTKNQKVIGKFKDECGGVAPLEFVGLRPKMYSILMTDDENLSDVRKKTKITCKGVKKSYVKNHLPHNHFVKSLRGGKISPAKFEAILSENHIIKTKVVIKSCLSAADDKRFILSNGVDTKAYGHYALTT